MLSLHTSVKFCLLCLPKTSKIHANDTSKCKLLYRRETLHRYHLFILFSLSSNCNCISHFADLESLPNILARHYAVLRNLDKSLQDIQKQNEQRCEQEIEDIKREIKSGNITPDTSLIRFSDEALDEQKHSIGIADEKVMLAVRAYDLVDTHIQQLDQYLKTFEEELRERDTVAASALPAPSADTGAKPGKSSEGGRGGRKKTRLATATAATATAAVNPTAMDLDIPVDPNEPTYCLCNQVSYGEMVACENPNCKIEWFHFGCVGLKDKPKGKWYCPDCAALKNRRKGR